MADNIAIKTGVDKLVELVEMKKEISMSDAAKSLGVPVSVVEEWTDFLEEKGVVKVKYKFTVPYIVKIEVGRVEIQKRGRELETKKESVVRKAEVTMGSIKDELDYVSALKTEFLKLSKELSASEEPIKKEISILERFDNLKNNLEQELLSQQAAFKKGITSIEAEANEKYAEYRKEKQQIENDLERLREGFIKTAELRKQEEEVQKQLDNLLDKQKIIASNLSKQDAVIVETQDRLQALRKSVEKIGTSLMEKMDESKSLLNSAESKKNELIASQQRLLEKLSEHHSYIMKSTSDYKDLMSKTTQFFSKKEALENGFSSVSEDLEKLNKEMNDILKEARMLNAMSKSSDAVESIRHLEDRMKELEVRRGEFQKKVTSMVMLFQKSAKH